MRLSPHLLAFFIAAVPLSGLAQPSSSSEIFKLASIVEQLTLDRASAIAALQRRADAKETALLTQLGNRDRDLRQAIEAAKASGKILDERRAQLAQVTAERQIIVDSIALRDTQFFAEVEEYRRQIASLANSPDPRKRAALVRYAAGDRDGALDALVDIQKAETASIEAGWRDIAERALAQVGNGELDRDDAIIILDRVARLVASDGAIWEALGNLLSDAGRDEEARQARVQAMEANP